MKSTIKQLDKLLDHLREKVFQDISHDVPLLWTQANGDERAEFVKDLDNAPWESVTPETIWGEPQAYFWFKGRVHVPQEAAGKRLYLWVESQFGRVMGRSDPQCLVRINGAIKQGVDFNHREVLLSDCAQAGETFDILIEAGTIENRRQIGFGCSLMLHDDLAEAAYYDLRVPMDVARHLPENDHRRDVILTTVDRALNTIDMRPGNTARFHQSLGLARDIAREIYDANEDGLAPTVTLLGHTHIDVAWLWRVRETRQKMARSMATATTLMEEYPAYKFMYNQGYLLETLKEDYPEIFDKIAVFQKQDRFEIEGALWLEPDANMTGGESLIRHIIKGKRYHEQTFGVSPHLVWLPDTFGYSSAFPQLMQQSGLDMFITHKMSWNDTNKMPAETFWWEGHDGSRVATYFLTTQPMESTSIGTTYCPDLKASHVMGAWRRLSRKDLTDEVFAVYGHGDGGGGPTREMLEHISRLERGIPGAPKVKQDYMGSFCDRLRGKMEARPNDFPLWHGELYLEFHRGTYTSVAEVKRNNRKAEARMRQLEAMASYALVHKSHAYPSAELERLWDIVLLNQFHDILPGSSIDLVYEDSRAEFGEFFALAADLEGELARVLGIIGFNSTSSSMPQIASDAQLMQATPPMAPANMALAEITNPVSSGDNILENRLLRAEFDAKGRISSLIDKRSGASILKGLGNQLIAFRDLPAQYDAWDIDVNYQDQSWDIDDLVAMELVEQSDARATLRIEWRYESSSIVQFISLAAEADTLEISCQIDWQEPHTLLKASFPLNMHVTETVAEMQFGHVHRATHANTSWDQAKFEYPMHRWVAAMQASRESGQGVALLNDSKYGYDFYNDALRLTILRAPTWPWDGADIGAHELRYGIKLIESLDEVPAAAEAFNQPLHVFETEAAQASTETMASFITFDTEAIAIECIKKAEDSDAIIVRLFERLGRSAKATATLPPQVTQVAPADLLENTEAPLNLLQGQISLDFRAFEIKTLVLNWN